MSSHDLLCPLPFTSLTLRPDGRINPCCLLEKYVLGNIKEMTLEEAFASPKAQELRQEFLEGKIITCRDNMNSRNCHKWEQHLAPHTTFEVKTDISNLRKLDVRMNGLCNLECIMCNVWKEENGTYTEANFWNYANEKIFPNLKEIKILGGEPFIQNDFFRLCRDISAVNSDCQFVLWTNAYWNFTKQRHDILLNQNIKMLTISLDGGTKKVFEKIRKLSSFDIVMENVQKILAINEERRKQGREFFLQFDLCLQKDNVDDLENYILLARKLGIFPGFFFVYYPKELSVLSFDEGRRKEIYSQVLDLYNKYKEPKLLTLLRPILFSLDQDFFKENILDLSVKLIESRRTHAVLTRFIDF